jgi:quercetin dioxygenase-like cupin family protein/uncharacterized membrane protein
MAKVLVGLFDNFTDALNTVPDLVSAGIPREDISVVAHDTKGEFTDVQPAREPNATVTGAGTGAAIGGFGGLLLGLGTLAVPGIGPIIAAGPLAAMIAGATLGAATGGLIGALTDLGVPEDEARSYAEGVRRGGTVLTVKVADELAGKADDIMRSHRAVDINERVTQWHRNGGTDTHTASSFPATSETTTRPTLQPSLDMDDGRVILKKKQPEVFPPANAAAAPAAHDDTTIIKVNSRYSPKGKQGQKYLASGVRLSMRLWEDEQPGRVKSPTQRDYETIGYVVKGRAELQIRGQTIILEPGDSWVVPKGSLHRFKILEPFTAIEATCPPAEVHGRDVG